MASCLATHCRDSSTLRSQNRHLALALQAPREAYLFVIGGAPMAGASASLKAWIIDP